MTENETGDAFTWGEVEGDGGTFAKANGEKWGRCGKTLPDVGQHTHAGVCGRCDSALTT